MMPQDRVDLFDSWAASYDRSVDRDRAADAYPFAGHDDIFVLRLRDQA
jgi:hypothetical protein